MNKQLLQRVLDLLNEMPTLDWWQAKRRKECIVAVQAAIEQPEVTHITWNADGVRTVNGVPDCVAHPPSAAMQPLKVVEAAIKAQAVPAGMCLMPMEPTAAMIEAGERYTDHYYSDADDLLKAYRAMIAAHNITKAAL